MPQTVRIKRNFTNANAPTALADAELGYTGFGTTHNLYVGNTGVVRSLVSPQRQVELAGDQTITGIKTFDDITKLKVVGLAADAGKFLQAVDGVSGDLTFATVSQAATPPATDPEMIAGTRNDVFGTPLNTMALTGLSVTAIDPTLTPQIVPAINELKALVDALAVNSQFVGSLDAAAAGITWTAVSGGVADTLPPASAANNGWYLICDTAGTNVAATVPAGTYEIGDWLISNGTIWTHLAFGGISAVTASQVTVTPAINGATDVQAALAALDAENTTQDAALLNKIDVPLVPPAADANIAVFDGVTGTIVKDGGQTIAQLLASAGDVVGPASVTATDNIAVYSGTTGKLIADSTTTIAALRTQAINYVDAAVLPKVTGPAISVTDRIAVFADATGKVIKDSTVSIAAMGDVFGPALAVDSNVAVFDGTTGKLIKDGAIPLSDVATVTYVDSENAAQDTVINTKLTTVLADLVSIIGDGATVPLEVALIDGGTYV